MKELKSTYDTDFEDFNPACLSVMELSGVSTVSKRQRVDKSPIGKVVPIGLFSRTHAKIERPTDKITNIDPASLIDISKADLDCTATNTQSKKTRSDARVPVLCFADSNLRSANFKKTNRCRLSVML